jgi:hypothetical protein
MGAPALFRRPDGAVVFVPEDQAGHAESLGFTRESAQSTAADVTAPANDEGGVAGGIAAGIGSGLSGATLGLSDVALGAVLGRGDREAQARARAAHPIISTIGNVVGSVAPALLTGGASAEAEGLSGIQSLARATPAGRIGMLGSRIAESGAGGGLLERTAATATAGATEGALQNAGGYVSDVALGDRDLSAEGFLGAMGKGALYGGVAGGALQLTGEGLTAARRMFPASEMTTAGAANARRAATSEISSSLDDTTTLIQQSDSRLGRLGAQEEAASPSFRQKMDEIRLKAAQDVADAKVATARARQGGAEMAMKSNAERVLKAEAAASSKPAMDFLRRFETPAIEDVAAAGIQEATHAELAKVNPEAAKIVAASTEAKSSAAAMRDWLDKYGGDSAVAYDTATVAGKKAKTDAFLKGANPDDPAIAHFLGDPENTGVRIGGAGSTEMRKAANAAGAEAAQRAFTPALADAANVSGSGTEMMVRARYASAKAAAKAQDAVHTLGIRTPTGAEILAGNPAAKIERAAATTPAAQIDRALRAGPTDLADEIATTAPMITRHEAAHADLSEMMGQEAPTTSQARAAGFRAGQQQATAKSQAQVGAVVDGVTKQPGLASRVLGRVGDAGSTYEALRMMGVPLPDPHSIPVVGPLLSLYLKAKVLGRFRGKGGGDLLATAEGTIAGKAAVTRQRIYGAVDAMLGAGAKAATKAAPAIGGAAALGYKLFDDGESKAPAPYSSKPADGEIGDLYTARLAELSSAMQPGAIEKAVKSRISTSDPTILASIISAETRKLKYLYNAAPKPDAMPLPGHPPQLPSKAEMLAFGQIAAAAHDPAAIFERVAQGGTARSSEIDLVKNVYPQLYADAQKKLVDMMSTADTRQSYARRIAISALIGLPMDSTMSPAHAAYLQAGNASPAMPTSPVQMPHPTLTSSISIGDRTLTRLDR